ncbi:hypothetical protein DENSPDRAFT_846042 [Dentipellis sp. KUC8613]|nr:hypothetical protein DENSPDRAFT_846042 [Dentipellis sp. KUC8613]
MDTPELWNKFMLSSWVSLRHRMKEAEQWLRLSRTLPFQLDISMPMLQRPASPWLTWPLFGNTTLFRLGVQRLAIVIKLPSRMAGPRGTSPLLCTDAPHLQTLQLLVCGNAKTRPVNLIGSHPRLRAVSVKHNHHLFPPGIFDLRWHQLTFLELALGQDIYPRLDRREPQSYTSNVVQLLSRCPSLVTCSVFMLGHIYLSHPSIQLPQLQSLHITILGRKVNSRGPPIPKAVPTCPQFFDLLTCPSLTTFAFDFKYLDRSGHPLYATPFPEGSLLSFLTRYAGTLRRLKFTGYPLQREPIMRIFQSQGIVEPLVEWLDN